MSLSVLANRDPKLNELLIEAARHVAAKRMVNRFRAMQPKLEAALQRELLVLFASLGEQVAAVAQVTMERRQAELFEARWRPTLTHAQIEDLVNSILTSSNLRQWAGAHLTAAFEKWWGLTRQSAAHEIQRQGYVVDVRGKLASNLINAGGRRAGLVDLLGDTKAALLRAIDQAREAGLNPRQTARLIRDFVPEGRFVNAGAAYRAQLIARTETLHAQRASSLQAYRTTPNIKHVVAFDGDSDEGCAARDGEIFTIDDAEVEMYSDTVHPNCVLSFGPVAD